MNTRPMHSVDDNVTQRKRTRHSCSARSLGRLCNISRWSRSGATEISYERNTRLSFVQWMLKADILPEKISHVIGLSWQLLVYNSCATTLLLHAVYGVLSSQGLSTNHHVLHRLCFLLSPQTPGKAGFAPVASFFIPPWTNSCWLRHTSTPQSG